MKQIKLEVGKTYRNRKGEEVSIVEKANRDKYHFRDSDGEWYTESGRYNVSVANSQYDLIEEVAEVPEPTRHTFTIPEGTKGINVSKEGNRLIVEMVPEAKEPKPGDVMVNKFESVYLFKGFTNNDMHSYFAVVGRSGQTVYDSVTVPGRPATPEEEQPLWDALRKAGKRWSPEAMKVEDVPERERIMDFLQGYGNNVKWSHEQLCWLIEAYLKYRGGK